MNKQEKQDLLQAFRQMKHRAETAEASIHAHIMNEQALQLKCGRLESDLGDERFAQDALVEEYKEKTLLKARAKKAEATVQIQTHTIDKLNEKVREFEYNSATAKVSAAHKAVPKDYSFDNADNPYFEITQEEAKAAGAKVYCQGGTYYITQTGEPIDGATVTLSAHNMRLLKDIPCSTKNTKHPHLIFKDTGKCVICNANILWLNSQTCAKTPKEAKRTGAASYFPKTYCKKGHFSPRNAKRQCLACSYSKKMSERLTRKDAELITHPVYFTHVPCEAAGHVSYHDTASGKCLMCHPEKAENLPTRVISLAKATLLGKKYYMVKDDICVNGHEHIIRYSSNRQCVQCNTGYSPVSVPQRQTSLNIPHSEGFTGGGKNAFTNTSGTVPLTGIRFEESYVWHIPAYYSKEIASSEGYPTLRINPPLEDMEIGHRYDFNGRKCHNSYMMRGRFPASVFPKKEWLEFLAFVKNHTLKYSKKPDNETLLDTPTMVHILEAVYKYPSKKDNAKEYYQETLQGDKLKPKPCPSCGTYAPQTIHARHYAPTGEATTISTTCTCCHAIRDEHERLFKDYLAQYGVPYDTYKVEYLRSEEAVTLYLENRRNR